tara:strand:+ start:1185 stop:2069 length:885 start_codon:yes stop_codon:yes gene_type:complete
MYFIFNRALDFSGCKRTLNRLSKLLNIEQTTLPINNLIAMNCYEFGLVEKSDTLNYIIIVYPTDVVVVKNTPNYKIVNDILQKAKHIVVFSKYIYGALLLNFSIKSSQIKIIRPSVKKRIRYSKRCPIKTIASLKGKKFFISVGNLNTNKRPDYLFNFFKTSKKYSLIIIGDMVEGEYIFPKNVYHIKGLKRKKLYSCIKMSSGLVDTSVSGSSGLSILETMKLKIPVYAYGNFGNKSVITHGFNGLLFYDIRSFKFIIKLPTKQIVKNAYDYVSIKHTPRLERHAYLSLLDKL